jgi:hypothetical protein
MSKFETEVRLSVGLDEALAACRAAVAEMKWKVESQSNTRFVCKEEVFDELLNKPGKLEIDLRENAEGTLLAVKVSNWGIGPILTNKVKGQAGQFCNQLQVILDRQASARGDSHPGMSLSAEIQRLASLRDDGILSQVEFEAAKAKLLAS